MVPPIWKTANKLYSTYPPNHTILNYHTLLIKLDNALLSLNYPFHLVGGHPGACCHKSLVRRKSLEEDEEGMVVTSIG